MSNQSTTENTQTCDAIINHLVDVIENCDASDQPFSHFYLENVFPENIYSEMISNFPDLTFYQELPHPDALRKDGTSTRSFFDLTDTNCSNLPHKQQKLWSDVSLALRSPLVQKAVFKKLQTDLASRFNISTTSVDEIEAYPMPGLFRDMPGYKIKPHHDIASKIVTMQFYLPSDLSQSNLGTAIYRRRKKGELSSIFQGKFEKVKTFSFNPNSGYGFAVSQKSWHGRDLVSPEADVRNSLMLIYYREQGQSYLDPRFSKTKDIWEPSNNTR